MKSTPGTPGTELELEREHRRLVESEDRLREAHEVAQLSSWEWEPETDEVLVFQALAEVDAQPGTRMALEDILAAMPPEDRRGAREDLASIERGERDETIRRSRYAHPMGPAWLETRTRAVRAPDGRLLCVRGISQDVTEQELAKQRTAHARDFFQATLDSLSAHIAVLDEQGEIVMTNRAWLKFGAENGAVPDEGGNYLAACDGAAGDKCAARAAAGLRAVMAGTLRTFSLEYPCDSPTVERWFTLRAQRFEGTGDATVVVSHDDVTQRRHAEVEVRTQAALLDEVDAAVIATDPEGRITHWNRGAESLYGWTSREAAGRYVQELVVPVSDDRAEQIVAEVTREGHWEGEFAVRHKDGTVFPAYVRDRLITNEEGQPTGMIGVSVDMSERVASERALSAARDYLRAVTDSIGEGLFTVDTEGRVTYMNEAAEQLLGWSSEELKGRVMHSVTHTRRPDGSELPVEDCPIQHARRDGRPRRIEDDLFIRRDGSELPVAYTAAPFDTDDGVQGCVVVFEDISERKAREDTLQLEAEKLSWIGRIRDALAEDRFVVYAQPIVDLRSGDVVQRELLLRMREPNGDIVGPGAYLPIAEQYGLIAEIDRWVIGRGAELAAAGRPVQINLSARSVGDQAVLDHIERCIDSSGADSRLIVFEITETALVEDEPAARLFADRLHELGCKLALDDFGTGYGSFTYLKQFPVDYLKIDIEFVRDLATNPASHHVVEAVVALARGFLIETVAEGVQDAETVALLRDLGVDFGQGYHLGRPEPLGDDVCLPLILADLANVTPTGGSPHER
jgi:PAS domain S-box-containing protein